MDANAHAAEPTPADPAAATSAPRKFSLDEALRHWSDPGDLTFVDELGLYSEDPVGGLTKTPVNEAYFERHREWNRRRKPLIEALMAKLRSGELSASGIDRRINITTKREAIDPELWDLLKPGFKNSDAKGPGLHIVHIEVEAAAGGRAARTAAPPHAPAEEFAFSEGYRRVRIREHKFDFSGGQCTVIRLLHEASRSSDPWVVGKTLIYAAGYNFMYVGDAFRRHKNWRELIEGNRRGLYRLKLTYPAPRSEAG